LKPPNRLPFFFFFSSPDCPCASALPRREENKLDRREEESARLDLREVDSVSIKLGATLDRLDSILDLRDPLASLKRLDLRLLSVGKLQSDIEPIDPRGKNE
jgi:hypothetical protein